MRLGLWLAVALAIAGCRKPGDAATDPAPRTRDKPEPLAPESRSADNDDRAEEERHRVVFADRTSQAYLLMLAEDRVGKTDRAALGKLVKAKLKRAEEQPEVKLLLELVATPMQIVDPAMEGQPADGTPRRSSDLLGLHVELLPASSGDTSLVSTEFLTDPVLTRELSPAQRASLAKRRKVLVLRAHYRNRYAVRGLRLLQTLVRIVASERDALIHDPDTGETMGVEAFTRRRLKSTLGNVADQVAVVPFPDPLHGEGRVRLTTRGMRRFGSVDIELDGLPADAKVLQAATHVMYGLTYKLVRLGEFDRTGYGVELGDVVTVELKDIEIAYGRRKDAVPRCDGCPGKVDVHLVERSSEPQDPHDHVVARVVAPRAESDAPSYDHPAWAKQAISRLVELP